MTPKQERHMIASTGTILFMGLVFLLLWLLKLTTVKPQEQDYVEVTLAEELEEIPEPIIPKVKSDPAPSKEKDPGTTAASQSKPNNQPTQTSAEQVVSEEDKQLAIRQAREDSIAEANRQAKKKAEDLIGGFTFTDTEENGSGTKTERPGPGSMRKGDGKSGPGSKTLGSSDALYLPKPDAKHEVEGKVYVTVLLNADGKVKKVIEVKSDREDAYLKNSAEESAWKAVFPPGEDNRKAAWFIDYKLN